MNPIEDFDYRRIQTMDVPKGILAHCWKDLALSPIESFYRNTQIEGPIGSILGEIKKGLQISEIWIGLGLIEDLYKPLMLMSAWPTIDAGAKGLKTLYQFFPRIATMEAAEFNKDAKKRQRFIGILQHTDGFPLLTVTEIFVERLTGKDLKGRPITIPRNPYKGT